MHKSQSTSNGIALLALGVALVAMANPQWLPAEVRDYIPLVGLFVCAFAIVYLAWNLLDLYSGKIFLCLRRAYFFDGFGGTSSAEPDKAVKIENGAELSQAFIPNNPVMLFLGIKNDNKGNPLHNAFLKVRFSNPLPQVRAGEGWGTEIPNACYIIKFPESIGPAAINVSALNITYPAVGIYGVTCEIWGDEIGDFITTKFTIRLYATKTEQEPVNLYAFTSVSAGSVEMRRS